MAPDYTDDLASGGLILFAWRTRRQMNVVRFARIPVVVDDGGECPSVGQICDNRQSPIKERRRGAFFAKGLLRSLPRSFSHIDLTSFLPSLLRRRNSKAVRVQHSIDNSVLHRSVTAVALALL